MKTWLRPLLVISAMLALTACGPEGTGGDTTAPVITLKGSNPVSVTQHTTYTDAGATATDDTDGDITSRIVVHNPVDTDTVGTYTVTYDVNDTAGNAATQVKRTVNVIAPSVGDTTAPVITLSGAATIHVVQYAVYTDAGATATDETDGAVSVSSSGTVDTNTTDSYTITYTATDSAGNTATKTRTVIVTDDCSAADVFIHHNGTDYCPVTSPYTHKIWLDRNLGASKVCDKSRDNGSFADDAAYVADQQGCFGDYYQWGRNADGHEKKESNTTSILADNVSNVNNGGKFITNSSDPYDWASVDSSGSDRNASWSATDGSSVCPVGFRVPTIDEWKAELSDDGANIQNRDDAFSTFLHLPSAGYRIGDDGVMSDEGSWGVLWSASPDGDYADGVYFGSGDAGLGYGGRALGLSVRCLKD